MRTKAWWATITHLATEGIKNDLLHTKNWPDLLPRVHTADHSEHLDDARDLPCLARVAEHVDDFVDLVTVRGLNCLATARIVSVIGLEHDVDATREHAPKDGSVPGPAFLPAVWVFSEEVQPIPSTADATAVIETSLIRVILIANRGDGAVRQGFETVQFKHVILLDAIQPGLLLAGVQLHLLWRAQHGAGT